MSKVTTLTAEQWAWVRSERDRIISEARANGPADRERVEVITSFVVRPKPASRNSAASLTEKGETVRFTVPDDREP